MILMLDEHAHSSGCKTDEKEIVFVAVLFAIP